MARPRHARHVQVVSDDEIVTVAFADQRSGRGRYVLLQRA